MRPHSFDKVCFKVWHATKILLSSFEDYKAMDGPWFVCARGSLYAFRA